MTSRGPAADVPHDMAKPFRILCFGPNASSAAALWSTVSSLAPRAMVDTADFGLTLDTPLADLFVIDASGDGGRALEVVRVVRARGASTAVVIVTGDAADQDSMRRLGDVQVVAPASLAADLPNAIDGVAGRLADAAARPELAALIAGLRDTRQLIAAGEIARRVKHDINNPLAALLAEAQLMEMEPLPAEQLEAVHRIVELCRRVIEVARQLEGPGTRPTSG